VVGTVRPGPHYAPGVLSKRQLEILRLAAAGLTTRETASELALSVETVKTHRRHILARLEARTFTEAVAIGLRRGLIA
jgi:DNA-binding CsgD family transcriptional regulator